jgi:glucan endo-1,3-alpha-glucosidase
MLHPFLKSFLFILSIIVFATGALRAETQPTEKKVFAHFMMCFPATSQFGTGNEVEDYKHAIQEAQLRGIDGFALNCGAWSKNENGNYKRNTLKMYEAAQELHTNFQLFISADMGASALSLEEVKDMVETFRNHPNQFRFHGRPVLSSFGGNGSSRKIADPAFVSLTKYVSNEFQGTRAIFFVPFYYPIQSTERPTDEQITELFNQNQDVSGFFYFGAAGSPAFINQLTLKISNVWKDSGKIFMAPVSPFYKAYGSYNCRVFEYQGFEGMASEWETAIQSGADWVEIVTWNDYSESTYVSPWGSADSTSFWVLNHMLSHTAYLDASRYYIDWFKTGKQPSINNDQIYYFYRLHPADGALQNLSYPKSADGKLVEFHGRNTLKNLIYATAFLKKPAKLVITIGATRQEFELEAGIHHVSVPLQMGTPRFTLGRNNLTIIDKTGEEAISLDASTHFNYFSGAAPPNGKTSN